VDKRFVDLDRQKITYFRTARAWTQDDLRKKAGCGLRTIEKIEAGESRVRLSIAQEIASALRVSVAAIKRHPSSSPALGAALASTLFTSPRYRIVAFDLDGTLIHGLEYSWKLVWKILGFEDRIRHEGMQRYLKRHEREDGLSYAAWCSWCCEKFRDSKLARSHFTAIASEVRLTRNFYETVKMLKKAECILALVSGGMDTLLYELIPDADEIFDHISINKLSFDEHTGILKSIEPTEGDFEGKLTVIEQICAAHGATLADVAFIGDNLNDEHIIQATGLGLRLAYNAKSPTVKALSDPPPIEEDDLSQIIPYLLQSS